MNRNQYRIIFSTAKNMFIAVAENVKSKTKKAGQTNQKSENSETIDQSFHQMWQVKSLVLSMSFFMSIAPVYAQMQADSAATAAQQASIGVGQNQQGQNVPVINIQTPKNGVSHNVYNQFDVLQPGVVLNNSRNGAGSVIVGQVGANPYLQTGEARVILNEVNSAAASRFEGNLEVAGQRADVIIANPSGINIQGGGFINANKAIFTTGKAQLNEDGSIKQFVVDQGKINVNSNGNNLGLGGNGNNADYVHIYAKAIELNAQVHANQALQAITGSNTISEDLTTITPKQGNTSTTAFALDVKALGGMYANNIYIVGTDKGLGVNNAGTIQAPQNIVITNDGRIQNLSTIKTTNPENGLISLSTNTGADILSTGLIQSNGNIFLDSGQNLSIDNGQLIKENNTAEGIISVSAKGAVNFKNNAQVQNNIDGIYVDARNVNINQGAIVASNNDVNLNATNSVNIQNSPVVYGKKGLNIVSENKSEIVNSTLATAESNNINITDLNRGRVYPLSITGEVGAKLTIKDSQNNVITTVLVDSNGKAKIDLITNSPVIFVNSTDKVGNVSGDSKVEIGTVPPTMTLTNVNFQMNRFDSAGTGSVNISSNDAISLNQVLVNNNGVGAVNLQSQGDIKWLNTSDSPIVTGKLDLRSNGNLDISGTKFTGNEGINLEGQNVVINTELMSNNDINVIALKGNIQSDSLKATSESGKISLIADKDIVLKSLQSLSRKEGENIDDLLTKYTSIKGSKGIVIGSSGDGLVQLKSSELVANDGNINIFGSNGIEFSANTDSNTLFGNTFKVSRENHLDAKEVIIENKKSDININYLNLNATHGGVKIHSKNGSNIKNSDLKSNKNIELFSEDNLSLSESKLESQQHTALSSNKNILINSQILDNNIIYDDLSGVTVRSEGVISAVSKNDINSQNLNLYGGAILIETDGSFNTNKNISLDSKGSDLLKNDQNLINTDGDLIIQSNNSLTIDPRIHQLSAVGDIELISKNGSLNLLGYGGNNGKGSEEIIKINTIGGGVKLQGEEVIIQGSDINAKDSVKIIATVGDVEINAVKNSLINSPSILGQNITQAEIDYHNYNINTLNYFLNAAAEGYQNQKIMVAILGGESRVKEIIEQEKQQVNEHAKNLAIYSSSLNGFEHKGSKIKSTHGDLEINAEEGILIRAANIDIGEAIGSGEVLIESRGTLRKSRTSKDEVNQVDAGILIDGFINSYELGTENDANYSVRENFIGTQIRSIKNINIKSTGDSSTDNLIIQAAYLKNNTADIDLQSKQNIVLLSAQDQSYDRSTNTTTKRSWYGKKKVTTTTSNAQSYASIPTSLNSKNIYIKSLGDSVLYSTELNADKQFGGGIDIQAKNIKLLVTDEFNKQETDVRKKSSFLGLKYNDSTTNSSYKSIREIPVKATADYINTYSDFNTLIQGAEFNYLSDASITAGGVIILEPATSRIEEAIKKESNSVVWQSMQDKGSIAETAKLPSFNGPIPPVFKAGGGIEVQIPIGEQDQNKVQLKDEIVKLSNQPGNEYLKEFIKRDDVDWNSIILVQKDWDYKSQGLTGAAAAIIVIIVAVVTYGAGAAALGTTAAATGGGTITTFGGITLATTTAAGATTYTAVGAMVNAALTSVATQSSISLINNGGDLGKTLKDLGSKDSIKSLATAVVTAGLMDNVAKTLNLPANSTDLVDKVYTNTITSLTSSVIEASINGNLSQINLESILFNALSNSLQAEAAGQIHDLRIGNALDMNYVVTKILHAASGCAAAVISQKECEAGAIGAAMGEIVAEGLKNGKYSFDLSDSEKLKIENTSKIIAGSTAAALGYDVNTAVNTAMIAVQNNALADDLKKLFKDSALKAAGGTAGAFLSLGTLGLPFVNSDERAKLIEGIKIIANSPEPLVLLKLGMIQNHQDFKDLDELMAMQNDTFGRAMVDAKYTMDIVQIISGVASLPSAVTTTGKLGVSAAGYLINGTKVIVNNGTVRIAKTAEEIRLVNFTNTTTFYTSNLPKAGAVLDKGKRLEIYMNELSAAPSASNANEAFKLLESTMTKVENSYSGVKAELNPGLAYKGRMYAPRADYTAVAKDGSITAVTSAQIIKISVNGDIQFYNRVTNALQFEKKGIKP